MDKQQHVLLDEIGGDSLEGSGFENELPTFDQEFETEAGQGDDEQ